MHRHEDVLVYELDEAAFVIVRVAAAMNDPHLFDERALAGFARTCNKTLCAKN